MQFDTNRALYLQIAEELRRRIVSGRLKPGDRIMPVRQLAAELGVTPNTLQRAFQELEREDLLYTDRTSGRFVSEDKEKIQNLKRESSMESLDEFITTMLPAGFGPEEILKLVSERLERRMSDDRKQ